MRSQAVLALAEVNSAFQALGSVWSKISTNRQYRLMATLCTNREREEIKKVINFKSDIESLEHTIRILENSIETRLLQSQSEVADGAALDGDVTVLRQNENLGDVGGGDFSDINAGKSKNTQQGQQGLIDMGDFLSRPVEIQSYSITTGSGSQVRISPWNLWSLSPSVRAKIKNFAFLRGNLKVRISVSGTPFHGGRVLVAYQPLADYNQNLLNLLSLYAGNAGQYNNLICYLSQAPGSFLINVNENIPLEIELPFISTKPMHRLFNVSSSAISASAGFVDFVDAGDLFLYTPVPITACTATPSNIYIQVYAWMDNVELGVGTGTQLVLTTESYMETEGMGREDEKGPVERMASRVYDVSNALMSVPIIRPFATATSLAAGALRDIATIFGWSSPIKNTNDVVRVKNEPYQNGAYTIGFQTSKKICLDPQQELAVNPALCGGHEDEMTFAHIAGRNSIVSNYTWHHNDSPLTPIWTCAVHPNIVSFYIDNTNSVVYSQPSAMAFVVQPFSFWRGDIIFRFDVVCTKFHRGKLAVYYEPNLAQYTLLTSTIVLNKQFIKIIDIQDTQTFEVRVNWATYRSWLPNFSSAYAYNMIASPGDSTFKQGFVNGFIGVVPFTELQSPDDSDVLVIVSVYSDNLKVNGLTAKNLATSRLTTESMIMSSSAPNMQMNAEISQLELNPSTATTGLISQEHFGEAPVSFRSLLKRFITLGSATHSAIGTSNVFVTALCQFPIFPTSNLQYKTTTTTPLYADLFSYLRYSYIGVVGSIRYRIRWDIPYTQRPSESIKLSLSQPSSSQATPTVTTVTTTPALNVLEGTVTHIPVTNGGVEVEFPFYTNNLFVYSMSETLDDGGTTDNMNLTWFRNFTLGLELNGTATAGFITLDAATGEDFNFLRFQGASYYCGGIVS